MKEMVCRCCGEVFEQEDSAIHTCDNCNNWDDFDKFFDDEEINGEINKGG
jgi:Zn finger protein HypA/HybF involved in hydrogenase expression